IIVIGKLFSTNGCVTGSATPDFKFREGKSYVPRHRRFWKMETRDEIFDDANGDLAIGELESAVGKYRRCVELDPEFFDGWLGLEPFSSAQDNCARWFVSG